MNHQVDRIMLDIETTGTKVGCNILSIGAVRFSLMGVSSLNQDMFYERLHHEKVKDIFFDDEATMNWWMTQEESIRREAFGGARDPIDVIKELFTFIIREKEKGFNLQVFSNHSNFDFPIIEHYMTTLGCPIPWGYRNINCYATLANQIKRIPHPRPNFWSKHSAIADAMSQAEHCVNLLRFLN